MCIRDRGSTEKAIAAFGDNTIYVHYESPVKIFIDREGSFCMQETNEYDGIILAPDCSYNANRGYTIVPHQGTDRGYFFRMCMLNYDPDKDVKKQLLENFKLEITTRKKYIDAFSGDE